MKFSIIIPAYNIGSLVTDAVGSCLNQRGFDDFEVILVNDGSTDNTADYIAKYKDNPRVTIVTQQNMGLSAARNKGIRISKGDFILFLDGDDWLSENALSILSLNVSEDSITVFPLEYYYSEGEIVSSNYQLSPGVYSPDDFINRTIGAGHFNVIPAQSKVYPSKLFKNNGLMFIPGILHEDNPFFAQSLSCVETVRFIDDEIYYYRQNRQGAITSSQSFKNFEGVIAGINAIYGTVGKNNESFNYLVASLHTFQIILRYKDERKSEVRSYYRKLKVKRELWSLIKSTGSYPKVRLKLYLMFIDPFLLELFSRFLYAKKN